jgi:hypothetical protein
MEIPWPEWWNDMPPPGPMVTPDPALETSARSTERPTAALLDMLVSWLTANFGLAAPAERPQVELVPRTRLAALRYRGLLSDQVEHTSAAGADYLVVGRLITAAPDPPAVAAAIISDIAKAAG